MYFFFPDILIFSEPKYDIHIVESTSPQDKIPFTKPFSGFPDAKHPYLATVLENRELLNSNTRSTVHIEFDIKDANI